LYVDSVNGSDLTGSGWINRPFLSLRRALQDAAENDTVILRGGVHAGGVSLYQRGVTIMSYPGEWAVISAPLIPSIGIVLQIRNNAAGAKIKNLEIKGEC
jgi:hypothetical protein